MGIAQGEAFPIPTVPFCSHTPVLYPSLKGLLWKRGFLLWGRDLLLWRRDLLLWRRGLLHTLSPPPRSHWFPFHTSVLRTSISLCPIAKGHSIGRETEVRAHSPPKGQKSNGGDPGLEASLQTQGCAVLGVSPQSSSPASAVGWDQCNFWAVSALGASGLGRSKGNVKSGICDLCPGMPAAGLSFQSHVFLKKILFLTVYVCVVLGGVEHLTIDSHEDQEKAMNLVEPEL